MSRIVQKYGGAAVANLAAIQQVAQLIKKSWQAGHELAVVVSAMYGETNRLIKQAYEMSKNPELREYDVLISSGEQVSAALLSLALRDIGVPAMSMLSHQLPIRTDNSFSKAKIQAIDADKIVNLFKEKKVVVIAGFQGVDDDNNITTLGRGGSDLTAVAVAAAVKAEVCEVYKDVLGVSTTDPDICTDATLIKRISYEEMMELASTGAKVLQTRAVLLAKNTGVTIHVKSFANPTANGTIVTSEDELMEHSAVSAVSIDKNEAKIGITRLPDEPGVAAEIFSALTEKNIFVDMIVQNMSYAGQTALAFTVPKEEADQAFEIVSAMCQRRGWGDVVKDKKVAKVSAIGAGMRTHSGVASLMFQALAKEGVNIIMIGTSEIRISCLIEEKYAELALQTLHEAFALGKANS